MAFYDAGAPGQGPAGCAVAFEAVDALERLRRPLTRTTGTAFARARERVDEIGAYRLPRSKLPQIPPNWMEALARYALGLKAPLLERAAEPRRTAMPTAVMGHPEAEAIEEAWTCSRSSWPPRLLNTAKRKTEREPLSMLPQLEEAPRLARAAQVPFEELELVEERCADLDVAALWAAVEEVAPRAAVMSAAATVVTLVLEDEITADVAMRAALATRYATVRPSLSLLGESKALDEASTGMRVLAGVRSLPAPARRKVGVKPLRPPREEDIARLSPLKHRNLNPLGRCSVAAFTPAAGALRPLRAANAPELDEDDDGGQE